MDGENAFSLQTTSGFEWYVTGPPFGAPKTVFGNSSSTPRFSNEETEYFPHVQKEREENRQAGSMSRCDEV